MTMPSENRLFIRTSTYLTNTNKKKGLEPLLLEKGDREYLTCRIDHELPYLTCGSKLDLDRVFQKAS